MRKPGPDLAPVLTWAHIAWAGAPWSRRGSLAVRKRWCYWAGRRRQHSLRHMSQSLCTVEPADRNRRNSLADNKWSGNGRSDAFCLSREIRSTVCCCIIEQPDRSQKSLPVRTGKLELDSFSGALWDNIFPWMSICSCVCFRICWRAYSFAHFASFCMRSFHLCIYHSYVYLLFYNNMFSINIQYSRSSI